MINDAVKFEYSGFNPGYEIKNFVQTVAEKLHVSAPSDAAMKLAIEKGKGAVKASCQIASQTGIFVAEAVSDSPIRAVKKIEKKISRQLDEWKKRRFGNAHLAEKSSRGLI